MADRNSEKQRERIRERIVPRNNFKRAVTVALSVLGLAILGGLAAGVMFKIGETLVGQNVETRIEQFIIARDENTETEKSTQENESTRETDPAPTSGEEPGLTPGPETEPEKREKTPEEIFLQASRGIIEVIVEKNTGTDLFNTEVIARYSTVGVFVAESNESLYFLMDDSRHEESDTVIASFGGDYHVASFVQRDLLTGMAVYKLSMDGLASTPEVLALGNSFRVHTADTVYMIGTQTGNPRSFSTGRATYVDGNEPAEDGYHQHIYTDIPGVRDTSGVLLDKNGDVIGWVSEQFRTEEGQLGAAGISPIKYLIEDLCSGKDTAYMGVTCIQITENQAKLLHIAAGLYVTNVAQDSPAFEAGIQVGDLIAGIDDRRFQSNSLFSIRLDEYAPGDTAVIQLMRKSGNDYAPLDLQVTFGAR
ncbi:MAG: serine protease [Lachnospiraceae bacterium]|nr:serine protease [Lachnospiraceae bacterium]